MSRLAASLRERLALITDVSVHDQGVRRSGIVTFVKEGEAPEVMAQRLRDRRMNISVTPRTYAQLDLGERGLDAVARASVHYYNTDDEIERFCEAVAE